MQYYKFTVNNGTYVLNPMVGGAEIPTVVCFNGCDIISSITAHYNISNYEYVYSHTHSIYKCLGHLQTSEAKVLLKSVCLFAQLLTMTREQWPHFIYIVHIIHSM